MSRGDRWGPSNVALNYIIPFGWGHSFRIIKAELCRLNAAVVFSVHTINCITDIAVLQESAEILQTGISSQILLIQTILDLLLKSRPGFSVFWEKKNVMFSTARIVLFFNQITALRSGPVRSGRRRCARSLSRLFLGNAILNVNVPLTVQVATEGSQSDLCAEI